MKNIREQNIEIALINIDQLIHVEGNEPCLGHQYSINQFLGGILQEEHKRQISKDCLTIYYWENIYSQYWGREAQLLKDGDTLISIWKPAIHGHLIADGFHRLTAAKLAGLTFIGAKLAKQFPIT